MYPYFCQKRLPLDFRGSWPIFWPIGQDPPIFCKMLFLGAKAPLGLAMGVTVSVSVTVSHKKVSKLQDLARTSYIRYLPTIICKDRLVLRSSPVCVGVCPRF